MRRIAVHFWPAFTVISLRTSFIKISHSGISGVTSSPKTIQFKLSASMLKGTHSSSMRFCDFSISPVVAEPVNVITSCMVTCCNRSPALPQINCNAPSGKILEAAISFTTASVTYEVSDAGFTIAGTPANKFTAIFSSMPHTGKLNALMCIATPSLGTKICWPINVPPLPNG